MWYICVVVVLGRFGDGRFCSCGDDRCGRAVEAAEGKTAHNNVWNEVK